MTPRGLALEPFTVGFGTLSLISESVTRGGGLCAMHGITTCVALPKMKEEQIEGSRRFCGDIMLQ
jgi:hypothetical protein